MTELEGVDLVEVITAKMGEFKRLGAATHWVVGPSGFAKRLGLQVGDWLATEYGLVTVLEDPACVHGFYFPMHKPADGYWVSTTDDLDTVETAVPEALSQISDPDMGPGGPEPRATAGIAEQWGEEFEV